MQHWKIATASLIALAAAMPAHAQSETSAAPEARDAQEGDIIVTAQLREQNLVDVPIALTAYSGAFLDRVGIDEFDDLGNFVPGFDVQNQSPNNPGFVMRGITSDSGTAYNEPRVSVFQDGVSISKSRGSYVELFDVDRVEIAKGPQSTLYGRGALIGAVNIVQAKADPSAIAARGKFSYGNFNATVAEGMVNIPLGDIAAVRFSGRAKRRDGYIENLLGGDDFNSTQTDAARGAFHLAPGGGLTIDLIGNYQVDTPSGTAFKSIAYNPTDPVTGAVLGNRGRNSGAALAPAAGFEGGKPLGLDRKVYGGTGLVAWKLNDQVTLNSVTGWRHFQSLEIFDADGTSLPILTAAEEARGNQFNQDLRLTFQSDRLTAFVGGSYFHEDGSQRTPATFDERAALARLTGTLNGGGAIPGRPASDPAPLALFANTGFTAQLLQGVAGASGVALPFAQAQAIAANLKSQHSESSTNSARTNSYDLFGDVTFKVTDRFEIGGGIRYSHDDKISRIRAQVLNGRSILGGFIGALGQPAAVRNALLGALAVPGAANIPQSALYPVPLFGLGLQPTANNGDTISAANSDDGFAFRVTARYAPSDDTSLYATYSRGRRPELLSASTPSAPLGAARFALLPSETVDSYEVGAKASLFGRSLYLDGAAFYYRYSDFQTTEQQGTQFVVTNAGKAESYGFEGQINWTPASWLRLFATYAYNHSRFKTGIRNGNRFRLSPDHSGSLGASFTYEAPFGSLDFTPTVTAQSKVFFDDDNDLPALQQPPAALVADNIQDEFQKGFALVNVRLGYTLPGGLFRLEGFVDNLTNQRYIKDAGNTGDALGLPTFIAGNPRFYGISGTVKFGGR